MHLISILVFSLFISLNLSAQFHLSPLQEIDYVKNILPVGELNGELYTVVKQKKEVKLQVHSASLLELKREIALDLRKDGRSRDLEAAFLFDSTFVYVTSYANLTTEKRVVELFQLVGDSVLPPVELAQLSMKNLPSGPWREYGLIVDCLVSPDGKSMAVVYQDQNDMSTVNSRAIVVWDENLQPISSIRTTVNFPANQSKIRFNVKDQLVLLDGGPLVQKALMGAVVWALDDEYEILLSKPSTNYCIRSAGPGKLVLCGLYSYSDGGFMINVSGDKYSRVIRQEFDFPGAYAYQVMDLLVKENREVTLVMEEVVRNYAGRPGNAYSVRGSKSSNVEFGEIRLLNFSSNGSKNWEFAIPREEIVSEPSEFSSLVFSEGETVYILFNGVVEHSEADKSPRKEPMICSVREDGSSVTEYIFSDMENDRIVGLAETEKTPLLVPAKSRHFRRGCFLLTTGFFCYFGK